MANLMEILQGQLPPELLNEIGGHIGSENPEQTAAAASGVFSTILGGLAKNASTPEGAEALDRALERDHQGGGLLDGLMGVLGGGQQQQQSSGGLGDLLGSVLGGGGGAQQGGLGGLIGSVLGGGQQQQSGGLLGSILGSVLSGGTPASRAQNGMGILEHILGDRQEAAANAVSQQSGLSAGSIMKLLPILAPIVMQVLGKMRAQNNIGAAELPQVLGGAAQQSAQQSGMSGLLGSVLDRNGDGSMMDDILGMAMKGMMR